MANKFQKSVLERLEQENQRQKNIAKQAVPTKAAVSEAVPTELPPVIETPPVPEAIPAVEEAHAPETLESPAAPVLPTDIGDFLRPLPQRLAKNKTFYLDADLIDAIKATARQQGVTDSKLVNDILRRVLGLG